MVRLAGHVHPVDCRPIVTFRRSKGQETRIPLQLAFQGRSIEGQAD
jgi:hypothetical protein